METFEAIVMGSIMVSAFLANIGIWCCFIELREIRRRLSPTPLYRHDFTMMTAQIRAEIRRLGK